ncbi:uncharacterized protein LOC119963594 [Scyliorhinus canicula]|uniref:uncharacterized protein LOC119963594 n=1 Tax=Scyliorhinus canicula TaxID=7830 RepID=UPI0018F6FCE3|nr:uncharacterized protein LOC119963594 [Scyliorhinus canicula]
MENDEESVLESDSQENSDPFENFPKGYNFQYPDPSPFQEENWPRQSATHKKGAFIDYFFETQESEEEQSLVGIIAPPALGQEELSSSSENEEILKPRRRIGNRKNSKPLEIGDYSDYWKQQQPFTYRPINKDLPYYMYNPEAKMVHHRDQEGWEREVTSRGLKIGEILGGSQQIDSTKLLELPNVTPKAKIWQMSKGYDSFGRAMSRVRNSTETQGQIIAALRPQERIQNLPRPRITAPTPMDRASYAPRDSQVPIAMFEEYIEPGEDFVQHGTPYFEEEPVQRQIHFSEYRKQDREE